MVCFTQVDDEAFPEFIFIKECCEIYNGTINWSVSKFEVFWVLKNKEKIEKQEAQWPNGPCERFRSERVQALAGGTVLCSWARHLTLTVPLSTQEYK